MVKTKTTRVFILFMCFLMTFGSFGSLTGSQVSANENEEGYEDDEDSGQDEPFILGLPLEEGDEDQQVNVLKEKLVLAELFEGSIDETFDEELVKAVSEFQAAQELEVTGEYNQETREVLIDYLQTEKNVVYKIGDEQEDIAELKQTLSLLEYGHFPEAPSNYYGEVTKNVVEEFQHIQELEVTGAVTEETNEVLDALVDEFKAAQTLEEEAVEESTYDEEQSDSETTEEDAAEETTSREETNEGEEEGEAEEQQETNEVEEGDSEKAKEEESTEIDGQEVEEGVEEESAEEESETNHTESSTDEEATEEAKEEAKEDEVKDADIDQESNEESVETEEAEQEENQDQQEESIDSAETDEAGLESFSMSIMSTEEEPSLTLPFEDGDAGDAIVSLKQDLTALGFGNFPSGPSNRYGPVTMGVVEAFQDYYGLNGTGITDQQTLDQLEAELNTIYRDGQAHEEIREMKIQLTELGYGNFPESPSDRYGSVTSGVVSEFQASEGLVVNGLGDSVTIALLERTYEEEVFEAENLTVPYEDGDSGAAIVTLKEDLTRLGFGNFPTDPSNRYGPVTMGVVEQFQRYYGLSATGNTDQRTLDRLSSELSTIYRDGQAHRDIVTLKEDLTRVGYGNFPSNPSNRYGSVTAGVVSEFQRHEDLVVNGIGDSVTIAKLKQRTNEYYNSTLALPYEDGDAGDLIVDLKKDLTTLGFGNFPSNPSNRYGSVTMGVVKEFQKYFGLRETGVTDQLTMEQLQQELKTPYRDGQANSAIIQLKENLTTLGYGNFPTNPSNRYGAVTSGVVSEFQASQGLVVNGLGDSVTLAKIQTLLPVEESIGTGTVTSSSNLNVRSGPGMSYGIVGQLPRGTEVELLEESGMWFRISHPSITSAPAYVSGSFIRVETDGLSLPYEDGDEGDEIVDLKKNLTKLGFGNFPSSPSNRYGPVTEGVVKDFQSYYGLSATGKVTQGTLDYIDEVLSSSYRLGQKHSGVIELKKNLRQLGFGNFSSSPTNSYGETTERVVKEFQQHHGLAVNGIGDSVTLMKINSELNKIGETDYDRSYSMTLQQMLDRQMTLGPQTDLYGGGWQNAKRDDVAFYLDPTNFTLDPSHRDMYQFLVLSQTSGVSASQLNNILRNKGILHNQGAVFKDTAEKNSVNDIYLISHALLETGHGTSILSNGSIEVGLISTNKWVSVQPTSSGNRTYILENVYNDRLDRWSWIRTRNDDFDTSKIDMKKTYNMFGIEAVDSDPYTRGSVRAFREGWFTPEASIRGGAQFISSNYFARGQDTLYKMRWDPDFHESALNSNISVGRSWASQYATDIGWAWKQTRMIKELYDQIESPYLPFEIPSYLEK
ncbi:peptidoglycan-binding protein [Salipaludibacillus keqinensis]|uniref:peptidoglycan-binding protein n=1 Tax=Salipaludibacillus keqinensis TaxID=2045207 RepID=UPI001304E096|nr:peptidoglycan-binding protein [Salipaludibacillus keqinensis]